jgi:D-arabinose 1-dehydrogenase-like Zn-dependent alcohol dehydrogenase
MPFEEIVEAYRLIKSGDVFGRIVLTPASKLA